ncbi:3-hydroxyacyl-CoA dehydrogenase [Ignatzschineria rhizosphaerae]|uniref:3-hydroxyacyl-CoA dehydrogenase n=1 Tax=Ignatzschineria rhizosphaerae TaxID=2923279 RepID=A0ABY3X6I0_9GAMM|nr:3-hydroxyacyl-CoA dehydrogenase [Ignatzschineria rhizosphaerae]UNM96390.1 3-hydroxyacyl-CoA dehydrogenase [Ignatzschineria rhizosphaerae]
MVKQISKDALSVVVVGGGSIGISFTLLFAKSNIDIALYEPDLDRFNFIMQEIKLRIEDLENYDLLTISKETVLQRITLLNDLTELPNNAPDLVIECVPERLEIKQSIFSQLEILFSKETIFVSASSAIMMSKIAENLHNKTRCLIAHPGNPPHLIPIIELVPTPETALDVINKAKFLFESCGQIPVILNQEIEGFIFNRLQGAVLREAYCLVRDGIASVNDIDKVMTEGLGLRWSIVGPFETIDLNTRGGVVSHAEKMGPAYARMGAERGQKDPWTEDLVKDVNQQRRDILPMEDWDLRVRWRDEMIMKLLKERNQ